MALEQHAIPTEVSNYEFRLVGDMTLKQFAWLAGGILMAIIMYQFRVLPFFIRYPAIVIFALGGIAIAFIPYEGRSLDRWMIAFFKAIYSPTEFIWRKENRIPAIFESTRFVMPTLLAPQTTTVEQNQLQQFIQTLPLVARTSLPDEEEANKLSQIDQLFDQDITITNQPSTQNLNISSTELINNDLPNQPINNIYSEEIPSIPSETIQNDLQEITTDNTKYVNDTNITNNNQIPDPQENTITITDNNPLPITPPPTIDQQSSQTNLSQTFDYDQQIANLISGYILEPDNQPIVGALIEITNTQGLPVRALKSNDQGYFAIITPLAEGTYYLQVEHPQYHFPSQTITLSNQPVSPLTITSLT